MLTVTRALYTSQQFQPLGFAHAFAVVHSPAGGFCGHLSMSAAQDPTYNNRKPCMNALTAGAHALRHDWTLTEVQALFAPPFNDLLFQAQTVHPRPF